MVEPKFALPAWLPWATTACLAVFVACMGELVVIEKARNQLVRDENLLVQAELQASQNQLEAERIVSRRELEQLRPAEGQAKTFLTAPGSDTSSAPSPGSPVGVMTWNPGTRHAELRFTGLPALAADHSYQLWIEGPTAETAIFCGGFRSTAMEAFPIELQAPLEPGYRILLIDAKKGGMRTLDEVISGGSIVLATQPHPGKISNP